MQHIAIYCKNIHNRQKIIDAILAGTLLADYCTITTKQSEVFSSIVIKKILEQEYKHGVKLLHTPQNKPYIQLSSGQQRKALLTHILQKNPEVIILDDLRSNMDAATYLDACSQLADKQESILYIQLCTRKDDLLPFMQLLGKYNDDDTISTLCSPDEFMQHYRDTEPVREIVPPPKPIEYENFSPLVQLTNVSVSYNGTPVLHNIQWTIEQNQFWELRGAVGSGKTTLLSMILGDNPKAFGQNMLLFGMKKGSGESVWSIKKHIGYFYPKMMDLFSRINSIEQMVISGFYDTVGLYTRPTDWQKHVAHEWLRQLGIDHTKANFHDLSEGEQRIILVIRAMVKQPPLIVLDEPTVNLDDANAALFVELLQSIRVHTQQSILYVSHRAEPKLKPTHILELIPTAQGSIARQN